MYTICQCFAVLFSTIIHSYTVTVTDPISHQRSYGFSVRQIFYNPLFFPRPCAIDTFHLSSVLSSSLSFLVSIHDTSSLLLFPRHHHILFTARTYSPSHVWMSPSSLPSPSFHACAYLDRQHNCSLDEEKERGIERGGKNVFLPVVTCLGA